MLDNFMKMQTSKKVLVLVVVVLLIAVLFWYLQISPMQEELTQAKSQQQQLDTKLAEVKVRKKTYDDDRKRRDDLEIASIKQRQILPSDSEMASFLNSINVVADLAGLELLSVKPMEEAPENYYARIPVMLAVKGSYHQIAKFFYQIGKLDRVINVENIELDKPEITESGTTLSATLMATTFRALEKGDGAAAAAIQ